MFIIHLACCSYTAMLPKIPILLRVVDKQDICGKAIQAKKKWRILAHIFEGSKGVIDLLTSVLHAAVDYSFCAPPLAP
jgi:hypothetical protein